MLSSFSPSNSRFESWPVGLYPRSPECSMPPAMAPAPGLPLRPSSRRGREPLYPPISRVSSVAILVDRRLLTARASELHAAGHGLPRRSHCSGWPKPPQANPNRPSRDQRPEIEDTPSGVNLLKSPWIFLSPNPPSLAYFPECAIPFRKRKLHCLSQKYAFSIYRNAIRTVSLIELSF